MGGEKEYDKEVVTESNTQSPFIYDSEYPNYTTQESSQSSAELLAEIEKEKVFAEYAHTPLAFQTMDGAIQVATGSYQALELCGYLQNPRLDAELFRYYFETAASYYLETLNTQVAIETLQDETKTDEKEDIPFDILDTEKDETQTIVETNEQSHASKPNSPTEYNKPDEAKTTESITSHMTGTDTTQVQIQSVSSTANTRSKDSHPEQIYDKDGSELITLPALQEIRHEVAMAHESSGTSTPQPLELSSQPELLSSEGAIDGELQPDSKTSEIVLQSEELLLSDEVSIDEISEPLPTLYEEAVGMVGITPLEEEHVLTDFGSSVLIEPSDTASQSFEDLDHIEDNESDHANAIITDETTETLDTSSNTGEYTNRLSEAFMETHADLQTPEMLLDELFESLEEQIVHLEQSYIIEENLGVIEAVSVGSQETTVSLENYKSAEKKQLKNIIDLIQCLNAQIEIEPNSSLLSYEKMPDFIKKQLIELLEMIGYEHADIVLQDYIDYYGIERLIQILQYLASISYGNSPRPFMTPVTTPFLKPKSVQLFRSLARYAIQPIISWRYQANA